MKPPLCWLVLGLLALGSQTIQAQQSDGVLTTVQETVPFQLGKGFLILVEGRIGPLQGLRFVLDTGATRTLVDKKVAERLSLHYRHGKVLNYDRYAEIELANIPELQLGPLLVRNVEVMVGDLKQFSEFVEGVDAVIGLDLLRINRSLQIDYDARKVTFTSAGRCDPVKPRTPQAFMVRLPVQGQTIVLVMDTGRQGMLLYADRLRKHAPQLNFTNTVGQAHEGRLAGQKAMLSGVRLGDDDLQVSVFLIDGAPNSLPANIDGYLGTSVLNARIVEVDFEANRLRWE